MEMIIPWCALCGQMHQSKGLMFVSKSSVCRNMSTIAMSSDINYLILGTRPYVAVVWVPDQQSPQFEHRSAYCIGFI
jgi:hypothetical protein